MKSDTHETDHELREQIERGIAFLRRALHFWPMVPVMLTVGALACAAFLLLRKPTYRSETVILYTQGTPASDAAEQGGTPRNVTGRMRELLMSRPKLEKIVAEFDLYPDVKRELGVPEAVEELKQNIDFRAPGSDTFSIAFLGGSPREARDVTARLSSFVIEQDAELRKNQASVTRDFLITEKEKTEARLRVAERDLAGFMAKYPRFALDATPLSTGAAIRATTSSASRSGATRSRASGLAPRPTPSAAAATATAPSRSAGTQDTDSDFARASAALAAARAHLAEQLEHFTPAHPDVRAAAAAVERAESRLTAAPDPASGALAPALPDTASSPADSVPAARTAAAPARAARPAATRAGAAAGRDVIALETEWLKLTRAVTEARQRYDQVESALFKADILASSESGGHGLQMTIIDPPFLPARPQPPGRTLIGALFGAASLLLGVGLALLRAVLDDRILNARDARGPAELLVEIPRVRLRRVHVPA